MKIYCELCSGESNAFQTKKTFNYFKCEECSFIFLNPNPNRNDIQKLYKVSNYINTKLESKNLKMIEKINEIVFNTSDTIKFLDIGCQNGDVLNELSTRTNYELFGIEASETAAKNAQKNKKLIIQNGYFNDKSYENIMFDIVNLGDVIEHLADPRKVINDIYEILKPGGLLVITTPISNCPYVVLNTFINKLLKSYPLAWLTPPFHIKYFSTINLNSMMIQSGFVKIEEFYASSNFIYELAETQIFHNFKQKKMIEKINLVNSSHLLAFCITYLISKVSGVFIHRKFSYTAFFQSIPTYQNNEHKFEL
jgi:2-polyprenyl-3-methyl-5-hydroxy-6-metoxy-1,4-benzoquinol methylase